MLGQEAESSTLYNAYLTVSQQLSTYQQIASGLSAANYNSSDGTQNVAVGTIVKTSDGTLYSYFGANPGSMNLSTISYSTDTADWAVVHSSGADNPSIDAQITFDQSELATIRISNGGAGRRRLVR